MKTATLSQAVSVMKNGNHCLWVGAGVTMQLVGPTNAPSWDALVKKLELAAGLPASTDPEFPRRLEACKTKIGNENFRQIVRAELHDRLYGQIIQMALVSANAGTFEVPATLKSLAHLGAIGNPIVSFNIEMATAIALSRPHGLPLIRTYSKDDSHHIPHVIGPERPVGLAQKVFLAHGCLELFDCVLTADEYASHESSMAFRLATHQAYGSGLFIVGMSLQDKYLLEQIQEFRPWLGEIYWIQPPADKVVTAIAEKHKLTLVDPGSWPEFWHQFDSPLNVGLTPDDRALYATWDKLVLDAMDYLGQPRRDLADAEDDTHASPKSQQHLAEAISAGEGRPLPTLTPVDQSTLTMYSRELKQRAFRRNNSGSSLSRASYEL